MSFSYITDGDEIYRQSFAMIREESDLSTFTTEQSQIAVRMIHAAGETDLARDIEFSPDAVTSAREAFFQGRPIITDVTMVHAGITRARLPRDNKALCFLHDERTRDLARRLNTTRTAAAVELWEPELAGSIVAIGNAPTALFHLLNWLEADPHRPRPAVILGIPVGFIGAAESKLALSEKARELGTDFITVHGRRGGSAITCAAINALATYKEIL
ncbi:precorrin-8X methylmutase [Corynebacterium sp. ES2794-CONJ1]|uniref:precorrin-8X methylmutase n=1 Tax=unclassified Corynebacterium TaxID=2624378 RepID=UPI002167EFF0|nr:MULTISPECIES: precorrin-8X methylmutase [unclassified Corynebacterium]MCS4489355.1 precorrin-8X methylmutase [Corynebacterium sp. ES2775-CONJ]MCS4491168.1 precorrin-8X methylmutase [Corynebacterium sp. ES2715-CONJ3]MCS4530951.1 precorrin-8X methylmutase [Corynebacterium sp. ES2730-CONJ]MCU9518318.1 precorrin-8X methylmutase [Corynebacterium sp. ES2794-CONJ1]